MLNLKHLKTLQHVSILIDHHQGVRGCLVKVTEPGLQRTAPQGSPRTPATCIAATTPGLIVRILNSVF